MIRIDDLGMVDSHTPCTYEIEWEPMYTPIWSFFPRTLGTVRDSLRLPCPKAFTDTLKPVNMHIDGCYTNAVFGDPTLVHKSSLTDYEITDVIWFRVLGYLAVSPLFIYLSVELISSLDTLLTWLSCRVREFRENRKTTRRPESEMGIERRREYVATGTDDV